MPPPATTPSPAANLLPAFATPIGQFSVPAAERLNPPIRAAILERETAAPGVARSNAGGWHSEGNMLSWGLPEVAELAGTVQQAALAVAAAMAQANQVGAKLAMEAWANVSRRGAYNKIHDHPGWHLSAVYYVDAGSPDPAGVPQAGWIEFVDPRGALGVGEPPGADPNRPLRLPPVGGGHFGNTFALPPITGGLLVFPSWLRHWVRPYDGAGERISIAFNLRLKDVEPVA